MPTDTPLVSIIIPTYNRAHLIGETLDSVLAQTYKNWECIVVDDGSTDNTEVFMAEYIAKDSRFQYYHRPKDRLSGGNAARNFGFELSKGEFIQWFDSDDLMHPEKLKIQLNHLIKSDLNFCVCQNLVFEKSIYENMILRHQYIHSENPFEDFVMVKIVWMTPSAIWKKAFLQTFDYLFDEELKAAQEWEFHCRVLAKDSEYLPVNKALVYVRKHAQSISSSKDIFRSWNYFLARFKVYNNFDINLNNDVKIYLQDYFFKYLKKFIYYNENKYAIKVFYLSIIWEKDFSVKRKFKAFFALVSHILFNKGYFFLKRI